MDTTLRKALFVGSFDPFTIGHADMARRALELFDALVIGVGVNPRKQHLFTDEQRLDAIRRLYADDKRVEVVAYDGLAVNLARRGGAQAIVKGVRSVRDFEYERDQAELNRRLGNIETLLLFADPTLAAVSSSAYRELLHFHQDASWMLPQPGASKEG